MPPSGQDAKEPEAEVQQNADLRCENAAPCEPVKKSGGGIVAEYLESKLREDLRAGTEMPLEHVAARLDHLRALKEAK